MAAATMMVRTAGFKTKSVEPRILCVVRVLSVNEIMPDLKGSQSPGDLSMAISDLNAPDGPAQSTAVSRFLSLWQAPQVKLRAGRAGNTEENPNARDTVLQIFLPYFPTRALTSNAGQNIIWPGLDHRWTKKCESELNHETVLSDRRFESPR